MQPKSVIYSKTYHLGDHNFQKLSVEMDLNELDDVKDGLREAKRLVDEFNLEIFPDYVPTEKNLPVIQGYNSLSEMSEQHQAEDIEFENLKAKISLAETQEDALEIIYHSGNYKVPLEFQTRQIVKNKPTKN